MQDFFKQKRSSWRRIRQVFEVNSQNSFKNLSP